jgi:hypothetical protein
LESFGRLSTSSIPEVYDRPAPGGRADLASSVTPWSNPRAAGAHRPNAGITVIPSFDQQLSQELAHKG